MADETAGVDYKAVATGVEEIREIMAAAVAGLKADGFTDREARCILAGVFAHKVSAATEEDES